MEQENSNENTDRPAKVKISSRGGRRAGSGAKPGQHRIHCGELRAALERELGRPYVEMLAETQRKLFNDFLEDHNVKEFITFTENMSRRLLMDQPVEVHTTVDELSTEELRERVERMLAAGTDQDQESRGE
jgi:hypothetical protein